jgi:ribonuclease BN (tRNA processing enzyme)
MQTKLASHFTGVLELFAPAGAPRRSCGALRRRWTCRSTRCGSRNWRRNPASFCRFGRAPSTGSSALIGEIARGRTVQHNGVTISPEDTYYRQRGRRVAVVPDTSPCEEIVPLAGGSDVMICESTYGAAEAELAEAYQHTTAAAARRRALRGWC